MKTDDQLVEQAKQGNMQSFQRLVAEYSRLSYTAAYRILNDQSSAEDCVQEVFVKVYQKLAEFDQRSKFSTWLYSITVNTAIDMQRKLARHQVNRADGDEPIDFTEAEIDNNPENAKWQLDLSKLTKAAISQLNEELKIAFILRHFEERSIQEISQILEINPNTVKNRIFRAVQQLRTLIAPKLAQNGVENYESI